MDISTSLSTPTPSQHLDYPFVNHKHTTAVNTPPPPLFGKFSLRLWGSAATRFGAMTE